MSEEKQDSPKKQASGGDQGAPRWTYGLAAIVGAAALVWTVISHFIPKPEAPSTAPAPQIMVVPLPQPAPQAAVQTPASQTPVAVEVARPSAVAPCSAFLAQGGRFTLKYRTTSGPGEIGREQRWQISGTSTRSSGECSSLVGYFEGWRLELDGCPSGLALKAARSGEGDLTGSGTCDGAHATGAMGYTDAVGQRWGYQFTLERD
mgnify:CR=1 FL=1